LRVGLLTFKSQQQQQQQQQHAGRQQQHIHVCLDV
jgi:hypothetical protein